MMRKLYIIALAGLLQTACGDGGPSNGTPDGGSDGGDPLQNTTQLDIPVPATGRVYVSLSQPGVVTPSGDPKSSGEWDLAFEGYDVFTNSGVSGSGQGGAFGSLDTTTFLSDTAPNVPFLSTDKAGGALLDWYAYEGGTHLLYSRFHVYGVKNASRLWKVQILTYYGVQNNAPTSAFYKIRYAEITSGVSATQTIDVDGTAGGLSAPAGSPSGCIDLASGAISMLPPTDVQTSSAWDLCFRRDAISVNGEAGGPRGVGAFDLEASQTATEDLSAVKAKTADSEQPHFDGVNASTFASAMFRGDHVVSAFETGQWLDTTRSPPTPAANQAWLVVDASGQHKFLVSFSEFQNATTSSPGTIVTHIKPVSGASP